MWRNYVKDKQTLKTTTTKRVGEITDLIVRISVYPVREYTTILSLI